MLPAGAHFLLNLNVRVFHVEHTSEGLDVYVRMPMPYLVADKTGPVGRDGLPAPAPYTTNRMEGDTVVHFVAFDQVGRDLNGLGALLEEGLDLLVPSGRLPGKVVSTRVYPLGSEPGFATLDEAVDAFQSSAPSIEETLQPVYVGDAVVDVQLRYPTSSTVYTYRVRSRLNPELPGQEDTANLILDYGPGGIKVHRARGLLAEPVEVSRSSWSAFGTFVKEGVRHILEGLDHVLFVLCLAIGANGFRGLLWRVTGFTIGHSITLSLGFFGFVPSGDWFVPAVEAAIAVSIVYAAVIAVVPRFRSAGDGLAVFFVTAFIGLIHGLGFSFVLQNILKVSSPDIWQSLLAFNIGIEIGQLLIVGAVATVLWLLSRFNTRAADLGKGLIGLSSGLIAVFWVIERTALLMG